MTNQTHRRNLTVYQVTKTKVDVKIPILLNGKVQHRVEKLTATWIDKETGELFTEKQARLLDCPAFDYGIMILQREYILSKLSQSLGHLLNLFYNSETNEEVLLQALVNYVSGTLSIAEGAPTTFVGMLTNWLKLVF